MYEAYCFHIKILKYPRICVFKNKVLYRYVVYLCIFSQSGVTDFRAEHSISGIVRALSYKTTTQAVKSSKMLFNPQSPVKFVPQKVLSPIQI